MWVVPRDGGTVWPAIMAGLQAARVVPEGNAGALQPPGGLDDALAFLTRKLAGSRIRLVFDAVEGFRAAERESWFRALLNRDPVPFQVIVATRDSTAIDATDARLAFRLLDLRAEDLAFSAAETSALAALAVPGAGQRTVRQIHSDCGGWPACTALALGYLQGDRSPARPAVEDRSGTIAAYLDRTVLPALTLTEIRVIAAACICGTSEPAQAAALCGVPDAGTILGRLATQGLIQRRGQQAFVLRPVLRQHLLQMLWRADPAGLRRLHRRASSWHSTAGSAAACLRHAAASGEGPHLAAVLAHHGADLVHSGESDAVLAALSLLGDAEVTSDGRLSLIASLAHSVQLEPTAASRYLQAADLAWRSAMPGEVEALRELVQARSTLFSPGWSRPFPGSGVRPAALSASALPGIRIEATLANAVALLGGGRYSAAQESAAKALSEAAAVHNGYLAGRSLFDQAIGAQLQGNNRRAAGLLRDARARSPARVRQPGPRHAAVSLVYAGQALLRLEPVSAHNLAVDAAGNLDALEPTPAGLGAAMRSAAALLEAGALFDLGEVQRGLDGLLAARLMLDPEAPFAGALSAWTALIEHSAALSHGYPRRAGEVLDWAQRPLGGTAELCLLRAAAADSAGRAESAAHHLRQLREESLPALLAWTAVEVPLLECLTALRNGQRARAVGHLSLALRKAVDLDVLRPLAGAGPEVRSLLMERVGGHGPEAAAVRTVLQQRTPENISALTPRELEILTLLPSHLSLRQVAEDLQLSVNTVKTHVRILYSKLGVTNRHDAVEAAFRHGHVA